MTRCLSLQAFEVIMGGQLLHCKYGSVIANISLLQADFECLTMNIIFVSPSNSCVGYDTYCSRRALCVAVSEVVSEQRDWGYFSNVYSEPSNCR